MRLCNLKSRENSICLSHGLVCKENMIHYENNSLTIKIMHCKGRGGEYVVFNLDKMNFDVSPRLFYKEKMNQSHMIG